jgi:lipopolysaccharide/colanic/teichoic acid biosynthesis glycosyltransferase
MIRFFDLFFSLIAIIAFSLPLLPLAFLLLCTGEHKIFYRQKRVGFNGASFNLLKFATMLENSPNLPGGDITSGNDPRVLPLGKFLRKTKINELPQIVNILLGDISFVGPRPLTPNNFSFYDEKTQEIINRLKPGLTGIGSIVFRDEESVIRNSQKNPVDCYKEDISPYKGELERWFYKKQSIFIYFTLIFLTVNSVLFPSSKLVWRIFKDIPLPKENIINFNKR